MVMHARRNKLNIIMFFLAIIAFIVDYWVTGFQRNNATRLGAVLIIYFLLTLVYFILELAGTETRTLKISLRQLGIGVLLSALQIIIPYALLQYVVPNLGLIGGLVFFVLGMMCAPWILYFLFINPPDFKFVAFARVVWFIILAVLALIYIGPAMARSAEGITVGTSLAVTPGDALSEFGKMLSEQVENTRQYINQTRISMLHPEDAKSKIDKDSKKRLGVFIDDLRFMTTNVITNEPFEMIGIMETNTLYEQIDIKTNCFVESTTKSDIKVQGSQTESEFLVLGQDIRPIDCQFPGLTPGRYDAYFEANFKFETWAYLEYTFVDRSLALDFLREGIDINRELDIKKEFTPVFTDGPAQVMMLAANQPVLVDLDGNSPLPKFGLYLNRYWRKGEISSVDRIVVQMPKMINLTDCTPGDYYPDLTLKHPEANETSDYFHYYIFSNPKKTPGALKSFTCSMIIDKDMYQQEKKLNQKLTKTIVASVIYDYKTESSKELVRVIEPRI